MKISLTLIFTLLMIFLTSCSSAPSSSMQQKIINLNVETNDKNKELIIESLLTNKQKFNINFQDDNAQTIGIILLWLSAALTLFTGYDYMRKGIDHAISEDNKD